MKKEYKSLTEELNRIKELSGVKLDEGIFNTKKISIGTEGQLLIGKVLNVRKSDTGISVTTDKFDLHIDTENNKGYFVRNGKNIDIPEIEIKDVINQINKQGL